MAEHPLHAIERVETLLVDLPTIRPHVLSMATMQGQTLCLVRLHCASGVVGTGEGTTIGGLAYGEESPEGIKLAIDTYVAPLLIGRDATRPAAAMAALAKAITGNRFAKSAVETALYDALGIATGMPVSELLGGRVRERVPILWTLASGATATDIAEAERMLDMRRHDTFKLKIGRRALADDVAHVAAIKRALGDRASVRVDVNQAWDEPTARRGIAMLADAGIDLVEQPVAAHDRAAMERLTMHAAVPLMADEALHGPADAFDLARRRGADVFAVKIAQSGGLTAARTVAAIADAAGIGVYGGTMLEGAAGTIASAHLFATLPTLAWGTELFGPLLLTEDILAEPLGYRDFALDVPAGPGLGLTWDEDRVARFTRAGSRSITGES